MNIGIDLDDTIINSFEDLMPYFAKYFNLDIDYCMEHQYSYNNYPENLKDRRREFIDYLRSNKLLNKITIKENAKEIIKYLHDNNFKIIIITARNNDVLSNAFSETKKYLDENGVIYDKLFCEHDKHKILVEEKIDIFIDDNIKGLNYNIDACKYPILFNSKININEDTNFTRVDSWKEIKNVVSELNRCIDED